MENNHKSFLSILDELSGGRIKTPWLQEAGLTKGTISRLLNGDQPSIDILTAISRTENASLHWMTEARGAPYRVNYVADDADGWRLLDELLQEGGWTGYLFTDMDGGRCLVLTQPGEFEIKGRRVAYTVVEIVSGDIGQQSLERLQQAATHGLTLSTAEISQDEFDRLSSGHLGNYELLGWGNEHGMIHTTTPADKTAIARLGDGSGDEKLSATEQRLLARFRRLSGKAQQQLIDIAGTLGQA